MRPRLNIKTKIRHKKEKKNLVIQTHMVQFTKGCHYAPRIPSAVSLSDQKDHQFQ